MPISNIPISKHFDTIFEDEDRDQMLEKSSPIIFPKSCPKSSYCSCLSAIFHKHIRTAFGWMHDLGNSYFWLQFNFLDLGY